MDLKEKILKSNEIDLISIADELGWNTDDYISCNYKAMEELSKIVAIAFAKWCMDNTFQDMNTENSWCASDKGIAYNRYTDEQLYKLFTQSKEYKELMDQK